MAARWYARAGNPAGAGIRLRNIMARKIPKLGRKGKAPHPPFALTRKGFWITGWRPSTLVRQDWYGATTR